MREHHAGPRVKQAAGLMFVLLDAAANDGLIRDDPTRERWRMIRAKVTRSDYETHAFEMFALLVELEAADALTGSWIAERWTGLRHRIERGE